MTISKKIKSEYVFLENIAVRKEILDRIPQIDTLVFDVDGVLVDVRKSFRKAISQTVQFYFKEVLHFTGTPNIITPEEIDYFKMAGGFNNDWDLASAVVLFYLMKAKTDNLKNTDELGNLEPNIKVFTTKILPKGGGLAKVIELIEKDRVAKEIIFSRWDKDLITKIFQEIYAGKEYCINVYGFHPSLIETEGLIKQEKNIIDKEKREILQYFSVGILTGRNKGEAKIALERLGWGDIILDGQIITAGDGLEKPHTQGLKRLSVNLKTKLGIYIGDTRDDLMVVKNFNKEEQEIKFLSSLVLAEKFDFLNEAGEFYLREGVDILAKDVNCVLDLLAQVKK